MLADEGDLDIGGRNPDNPRAGKEIDGSSRWLIDMQAQTIAKQRIGTGFGRAIEELGRGEAYVRNGHTTTKIRTRILPRVRASHDQIEAIATRYAMSLMTPAAEARALVDGTGDRPIPGPTAARVSIWGREPLT